MGCCGSGGLPPQADGTSEEFFRLIPADATVRITVPDAVQEVANPLTGEQRRLVVSCENRENQQFDLSGVGVWVSFASFSHAGIDDRARHGITYALRGDAAWRHRNPVDLAAFIRDNHATTVLAVIDMNSGLRLDGVKGASTVRANMIEVIRLAQARDMAIFDVYCANNVTHVDLRNAIDARANAQAYPHHRTFEKPGTGGACDPLCLEVGVQGVVRFTAAIAAYANVIVMGFDASICVGKSVFGGWNMNMNVVGGQNPERQIRYGYEQGILDLGKNVISSWKVLVCGNPAGALCNGYLKYRPD